MERTETNDRDGFFIADMVIYIQVFPRGVSLGNNCHMDGLDHMYKYFVTQRRGSRILEKEEACPVRLGVSLLRLIALFRSVIVCVVHAYIVTVQLCVVTVVQYL
jgi:hypothetical protein